MHINKALAQIVHTKPIQRGPYWHVATTLQDGSGSEIACGLTEKGAQIEAARIKREADQEFAKIPMHPDCQCGRNHDGSRRLTKTARRMWECDGCGTSYTIANVLTPSKGKQVLGACYVA